jgi:hypothetical protein
MHARLMKAVKISSSDLQVGFRIRARREVSPCKAGDGIAGRRGFRDTCAGVFFSILRGGVLAAAEGSCLKFDEP